jgi:hypothetical protein
VKFNLPEIDAFSGHFRLNKVTLKPSISKMLLGDFTPSYPASGKRTNDDFTKIWVEVISIGEVAI